MRFSELLEQSQNWFILSKNGVIRAVNEDDPLLLKLWNEEGWDTEWDSARSPEEGIEKISQQTGYLPWDKFDPVGMTEPKVLYRSVSLGELKDIIKTGKIIGRQNKFNGFDPRPWVFFGDSIDDGLIWQGEEVDRQASAVLQGSAIEQKFNALIDEYNKLNKKRMELAKWELQKYNATAARTGRRQIELDADEQRRMDFDEIPYRVAILLSRSKEYEDLRKKTRLLNDKVDKMRNSWREKHKELMNKIREKTANFSISSAIIQTKPISGGLHYSKSHGKSGMQGDEYGFPSGKVTLNDIDKVYMVKDKKVVGETTIANLKKLIKGYSIKETTLNDVETFAKEKGVDIDLSDGHKSNELIVSWIDRLRAEKGSGREVMNKLHDYADKNKVNIQLVAHGSNPKLISYYSSMGYRKGGKTDDGTIMIRKPK